MPCTYDDNGESEREMKRELDRATRLLCQATARLEDNGLLPQGSELHKWSEEHKAMDRRRKERQRREKEGRINDARMHLEAAQQNLNRLLKSK